MSDHIKTGIEIMKQMNRDVEKIPESNTQFEQWVSLSWLREQINERRNTFSVLIDISELNWVLKLLEMEGK